MKHDPDIYSYKSAIDGQTYWRWDCSCGTENGRFSSRSQAQYDHDEHIRLVGEEK